jgi:hypothetical protein
MNTSEKFSPAKTSCFNLLLGYMKNTIGFAATNGTTFAKEKQGKLNTSCG